jgi:uncharacterized glyoxalase superfamily protein PhnB
MNLTDVVPNLIVADMDRSVAFYRDVLGFSVVTTVPDQAPFAFAWMQRGTVSVFLNSREAAAQDEGEFWKSGALGGTISMYFTMEAETPESGVDALFESVHQKARVVMPLKNQFYGMREFAIEDSDGYVLIFAQRTA